MAEEEAKYSILREVGRGSYGVVYEAVANRTKRRVAVKRMPCNVPESAELALQELWALQSVQRQHQNVIQLEECVLQRGRLFQPLESRGSGGHLLLVETCLKGRSRAEPRSACSLWFVTEFCEGGTMNEFLLARGPDARLNGSFMRQLSSAVAFLHRKRIVHRDLKADNILVAHGRAGPVVADFGLSKVWEGALHGQGRRLRPRRHLLGHGERITFRDGDSQKELLGTYICQGKELIPLGEALLENPNLKLQIPLKNKESMPEDLCQLLHHMLASNPRERLDAFQLELRIRHISYGKKRPRSGSEGGG
ncbi:unnamed protein product [Coccothraustes coccothraustes]